jgi:hypothetical protein
MDRVLALGELNVCRSDYVNKALVDEGVKFRDAFEHHIKFGVSAAGDQARHRPKDRRGKLKDRNERENCTIHRARPYSSFLFQKAELDEAFEAINIAVTLFTIRNLQVHSLCRCICS